MVNVIGKQRVVAAAAVLLFLSGVACTFAPKYSASAQRARRTVLKPGADLQAALDSAKPGETIVLPAGAVFKGPIKLPKKTGAEWITVQSAALESELPPAGTRVTPAHARAMPKIVTEGRGEPALLTAPGAHHFRFIGIEFAPADENAQVGDLIKLGAGKEQTTVEQVPHHLAFERCYIHGLAGAPLKRGVALNSAHTDLVDSYIADFKAKGQDAQAVCGWNGPGPFRLINNYLEGSGENVMFGGDSPRIPNLVPSDIEIRGNHFSKPLAWRGGVWTVKNLFEIKNARRVVIDGNLFENNWKDGQTGIAILFKSSNPGKAPWSVCEDIMFTNNVVRHAGGGVSILGFDYRDPSEQTKKITIRNNLFEDIGGEWGAGRFLTISQGPDAITFDHNTILHTGHLIITSSDKQITNFVWTNNIAAHNKYGIRGDDAKPGTETLNKYFPGAIFENNVIAGAKRALYPAGNYYPASLGEVKFAGAAEGNYSLSAASPFKRASGKAPGCDYEALRPALRSATVLTESVGRQ